MVGLFQLYVALEYGVVFRFVKAASQGATDDAVNFGTGIKPVSDVTTPCNWTHYRQQRGVNPSRSLCSRSSKRGLPSVHGSS